LFKPTIFFAFLFLTQFALAQSPYQNPIPKLYARPLVKYRVNLDAIKIDTNFISLKNIKKSPKNYWTKKNTIGVDASQVSFVNWNAGGNNAVSGLVKTLWRRTYKRNTLMWNNEIGFLITHEWETKVYENIVLSSRSSIYSDYLNDFGNIDLDLETVMSFVVNEYVKASFSTHFLYDNDVKFKEDTNSDGTLETLGSRLQLKQLLAIGLVYDF
jgi:hypothetical protein